MKVGENRGSGVVLHPGVVLRRDYFDRLEMSVTEFAKKIKVSRPHLSLLLNGKTGISPTMALRLGKAFRTTPEYWLVLQVNYELSKVDRQVLVKVPVLI